MKFSSVALLAAMATTADAFAPAFNTRPNPFSVLQKSKGAYDFDGLDTLSFPKPEPEPVKPEPKKKAPKAKKEPEPAPVPAPTPEPKKKAAPKAKKAPEPAPAPAPAPKPEPKKKVTKKVEKAVPTPDPISAKLETLKAPKTPAPKAPPKTPPAPKKSTPASTSDSSALPLGVALGAAPLVAAPVVALSAGRSFLAKTQARRAEIQEEIAAQEAAKAKKKLDSQVDAGGVAQALVRYNFFGFACSFLSGLESTSDSCYYLFCSML